jgi:serine phosphatase RsbU (regulator of sigma subunit)
VAAKTNQVMQRFTETESYVTLWFGLLNAETGQLRYISAGHPPAMVMSIHGEVRQIEGRNPILGAFENATFFECQTILVDGDRLILYSDGVTEARSPLGTFLGEEGLTQSLRMHSRSHTSTLSQAIMDDVRRHSDGLLRDDAAILTVEAVALQSL